jgi:hypothetical protein
MVLKERQRERKYEEEDVSSYWMTKWNWRVLQIESASILWKFVKEETMDLS